MKINDNFFLLAMIVLLSSCQKQGQYDNLGKIDIVGNSESVKKAYIHPKSEEEIRKAYRDYLSSADIDDRARASALSRLAELELSNTERRIEEQDATKSNLSDDSFDKIYDERIDKTIQLLITSLRDYPDAKSNDTILYQLAKAYAQKGDQELSIKYLNQLVDSYPQSEFYVEAQFRIGEDDFSRQDYSSSEYAYSEVIVSPDNKVFYEKALFKRGWSRFKQQYYTEAVDDFLETISEHEFGSREKLKKSELELFNEYFRSVGLSFSYMGGVDALHSYFQSNPDFKYIYYTYSMIGDIYLKEERYSDAAMTFQQFMKDYPDSDNIPYAHLKTIEAWQKSGFDSKVYESIENFYVKYNPSSKYWVNQNENSNINRVIHRSLKKYVVLMSGYYHNKYQKSSSVKDYKKAEIWYKRYLQHYGAYAQNDNIYFLYAELLSQNNKYQEALLNYEKAAYQNGLIVNRDAAYATIASTDYLFQTNMDNSDYLHKHISYALKFAQAYPDDLRTESVTKHAAELAFNSKDYKTAIQLSDIYLTSHANKPSLYISGIKAESYFNLGEYTEAESLYLELSKNTSVSNEEQKRYYDKLALSIYKQGDIAIKENNPPDAVKHYSRISNIAPHSEVASKGLYDAIALDMKYKQWQDAIDLIGRFQSLYPDSDLQVDVSKKLSAAYLNSDQGIKAAQEFVKLSSIGNDNNVKASALWKAAELYETKDQTTEAIHAYESYAKKFPTPFPQYMEAMFKLTDLYSKMNDKTKVTDWRQKIVSENDKALNNIMTDRTKFIASSAYLGLANTGKSEFDLIKLSLPLKDSLNKKKKAMQKAVKYYGKASEYKIFDIVTESTNSIATIYRDFSKALLASDRPKNLNEEELNQYEILLEDQAFPFEDKAIQFYEINLARIKDGYYNESIKKSHNELITLFPARYKREPKQDDYIQISSQ